MTELMLFVENFIKKCVTTVLKSEALEMIFLSEFIQKEYTNELTNIIKTDNFRIITYTEAINFLKSFKYKISNKKISKSKSNNVNAEWGLKFTYEQEIILVEYFNDNKPLFIINLPKHLCKYFYKVNNQDSIDSDYCNCGILLLPNIGEILKFYEIDLENLSKSLLENSSKSETSYALKIQDLLKFGKCDLFGFSMGVDRLVMLLTGCYDIKEVIPYPRTNNIFDC